jgi:hypothetical protein
MAKMPLNWQNTTTICITSLVIINKPNVLFALGGIAAASFDLPVLVVGGRVQVFSYARKR